MTQLSIKLKNVSKTFTFKSENNVQSKIPNVFSKSHSTKITALNNITLDIPKGEFVAIIGRNGSGKTTLLRSIAGIYTPNLGEITVSGTLAPLLHIGTGFHQELDAKENILLSGLLMGMEKNYIEQKTNDIIKYAELEKFTGMKLKHYSTGMRSRLAFSLALQLNPDILLIDEILSVGDKKFREKSFESFLSLKKENRTIVLVTHNLDLPLKIADRVILMEDGKISSIGIPEEVIKKYNNELQDNEKK